MQPTNTFYLDKATEPFADTLAAHGFAAVLHMILARAVDVRAGSSVRTIDCGAYYRLDCSSSIDDETIVRACDEAFYLFPAIRTAKNADSLTALPDYMRVDYEAEGERRSAYFDWFNVLPREMRISVVRGEGPEDAPDPPHRHWDIFRAVNPAALSGHNRLAINWWAAHEAMPQVLNILLDMTSYFPNNLDGAMQAWRYLDAEVGWGIKPKTSALQLFNPSQGKGQNQAKANRLGMGPVHGFWLLEWLKVVGFYQVALTRRLADGDRKSYVLAPLDVASEQLPRVMERFGRSMLGTETAVRSDVLAALRFTRTLLEFARENRTTDLWERLMGGTRPRDIVGGFHTAFYKKLGNAIATMNISFIALPGWVRVQDAADVDVLVETLNEHERIVRQFDESHSGDVSLLQAYRDFLSGDDLNALFAFTTAYASFLIGRRERGLPARQLTTDNLGRLLMSTQSSFSEIIESEGFQNVAYAIRQSTVTAQWRKQQGDRRYDVRYGLNHELSRAARRPDDFIAALSEFMGKYNAENAQVMETREGPYRASLTTADVEQMVWLVDQYGPRLICNLLIAYGYARLPRERQEEQQSA